MNLEKIPFTIMEKYIVLRTKSKKRYVNLFTINSKTMSKEIKEELNEWTDRTYM